MIPIGREQLWELLLDVGRVGRCFPGVEQLTQIDDQSYQGTIKVRVGPVSFNATGKLKVVEMDKDRWHSSLRLEGADRRIGGEITGKVGIDLKERSVGETEMVVAADLFLVGKLASLGQSIIRNKAQSVIQEFAQNLRREAASL